MLSPGERCVSFCGGGGVWAGRTARALSEYSLRQVQVLTAAVVDVLAVVLEPGAGEFQLLPVRDLLQQHSRAVMAEDVLVIYTDF